jgi:hypothetical protein
LQVWEVPRPGKRKEKVMSKVISKYVFPVGEVKVKLITKDEFNKTIKDGRVKGHTHCQIMRVGYCDQFLPIDSAALDNIAANIEGHGVYAVSTGFPFYSNCNRHAYKPYVSGVTERENNSLARSFATFMNS